MRGPASLSSYFFRTRRQRTATEHLLKLRVRVHAHGSLIRCRRNAARSVDDEMILHRPCSGGDNMVVLLYVDAGAPLWAVGNGVRTLHTIFYQNLGVGTVSTLIESRPMRR
jgi:hypothetical protein